MQLLPALEKAKVVDGHRARVVFTASSAADFFAPKGAIDYESLKVKEDGTVGNGLSSWPLYGQVGDDECYLRRVPAADDGLFAP